MGSCWNRGAGVGRLKIGSEPALAVDVCTYTDGDAVAPLVEVLLIFLACSLTLDLASTMELLGPDVVERKRARGFAVDATRILVVAGRDIGSKRCGGTVEVVVNGEYLRELQFTPSHKICRLYYSYRLLLLSHDTA